MLVLQGKWTDPPTACSPEATHWPWGLGRGQPGKGKNSGPWPVQLAISCFMSDWQSLGGGTFAMLKSELSHGLKINLLPSLASSLVLN